MDNREVTIRRTSAQADAEGQIDVLFTAVYARLKAMAGSQLSGHARGTLNTTALVHEVYLRLVADEHHFEHDAQFFAYAAQAMRHLLIDRARARLRRREQWLRITLTDAADVPAIDTAERALAMDAALDQLAAIDARAAQVVELRYFAGLTLEEVADILGLARRTVDRDWQFARAFLQTAFE